MSRERKVSMSRSEINLEFIQTRPPVFTPSTPEQLAEYRRKSMLIHGGTYIARSLAKELGLSTELEDAYVKCMRTMRRLRASRERTRQRQLKGE